MCVLFFYELQVVSSVNIFKLVCYNAVTPQRQKVWGLTLIDVLTSLIGGEEQRPIICFVIEAFRGGGLYQQGLLSCRLLSISDAGINNLNLNLNYHHSNNGLAYEVRTLWYPSIFLVFTVSCLSCKICVQTAKTGGVNRPFRRRFMWTLYLILA